MATSTVANILARLHREAENLGRPEQRMATLARLVEACDAIADGSARAIVRKGHPSAELNFIDRHVSISPPRIEEYVIARRMLDQRTHRKSDWTGPTASTLRKEGEGMLAYVRLREVERAGLVGAKKVGRSQLKWWQLVDAVPDEQARGRLIRELAEGSEAKRTVAALKRAVYLCSPSFDIDAYLQGRDGPLDARKPVDAPCAVSRALPKAAEEALRALLARLRDKVALAAFDLEFDGQRVRQRATKETLVSSNELKAMDEVLHNEAAEAAKLGSPGRVPPQN